MSVILPVIMCGGSGTRLWPLSRRLEPKQFQKLIGNKSLFQETLERFGGVEFGPAFVLVNMAQESRTRLELRQVMHPQGSPRLIAEPAVRSTAPAIAAAAKIIAAENPEAIMLVVPSDHQIGRPERLLEAYLSAIPFVEAGGIALFGIQPTVPETGFGYIRAGDRSLHGFFEVEAFIEKPDIERATQLVADPRHTWNSGMFMFRAAAILEELARFSPAVLAVAEKAVEHATYGDDVICLDDCYGEAPEISIDHAVMEHSKRLGVLPVSPEWNDLGSFEALWEVGRRNVDENVVLGETVLRDVRRSYIRGGSRLVSVVGLSNIVVVDTDDAVLVASRAHCQDVKFVAQHLQKIGHVAADAHLAQQLPGGRRRFVEGDDRYRVEHLTVFAGQELTVNVEPSAASRCLISLESDASIVGGTFAVDVSAGASHPLPRDVNLTIRNGGSKALQVLLTTTFSDEAALAISPTAQMKVI